MPADESEPLPPRYVEKASADPEAFSLVTNTTCPPAGEACIGSTVGGLARITVQGRDAFPFNFRRSGRRRVVGHLRLPDVA